MISVDWTAIAALVTAIGAIVVGFATRRKQDSEASSQMTSAALALVVPLRTRLEELELRVTLQRDAITDLTKRIQELEQENRDLREGVEKLISQVVNLGHKPVWRPRR